MLEVFTYYIIMHNVNVEIFKF